MFDRRHLMKLSLMAALAPAGRIAAAPKTQKEKGGSAKKGLGIGSKTPDFDRKLKSLNCAWFHNWTGEKPDDAPRKVEFVPTIWKYRGDRKSIEKIAAAAKKEKTRELLGFSKPERTDGSNMSVREALDAWPILQKTGLRLGSPACASIDNDWMKDFMNGVAKDNLKVDFICVNFYTGPNAEAAIKRLEEIHKIYNRPVWITELAVADLNAMTLAENRFKPDQVLKFMQDVLPELERLDYVERYAWFPADIESRNMGHSALWDADGKLTPLGEFYRDY